MGRRRISVYPARRQINNATQDQAATAGGKLKVSRGEFPAPGSRLPRRGSKRKREIPGPPQTKAEV